MLGHEDARLELYSVPPDEGRCGVVSLACGGTTVLDDVALVDPTDPQGAAREPWSSGRLEGVIDFPDLVVAPGTRRGFVPDEAALDFLIALEKLEQLLRAHLAEEDRQRARVRREQVARDIRRAFRLVAQRLPQNDLMEVRGDGRDAQGASPMPAGEALGDSAGDEGAAEAAGAEAGETAPAGESPDEAAEDPAEAEALFAPGPLAALRIQPARLRLPPSAERRLVARPQDADGRRVREGVEFAWSLEGQGRIESDGATAVYRAPDDEGQARITAVATQGELTASAGADVRIDAGAAAAARTAGIPEPQPVNAPSEPWRSRLRGAAWQYNEGHRDYLAVADEEGRRLRYLIHLFAKEVVLKNFGSPMEEETLERMVEVLTYLGDGRAR